MNYELMWTALKHALIDKSSDDPNNPFYPAVMLVMSGMEWYSDLQEKELKEATEGSKTQQKPLILVKRRGG